MNDLSQTASIPPQLPNPLPITTALGDHPDDRIPITGPISAFEAILRQPRRVIFHLRQAQAAPVIAALCGIALLSALVYGLVVGTFAGGEQLWAAPAKIAGGMLITALICLPSLYIFSCLSGSQARLIEVVGLIWIGSQKPGSRSLAGSTLSQKETVPLQPFVRYGTFRAARKNGIGDFFFVNRNA